MIFFCYIAGISLTTDRRAVFSMDERHIMTLPEVNSWVIVQVTHIFTPNHICVCFPYSFTSSSDENGSRPLFIVDFETNCICISLVFLLLVGSQERCPAYKIPTLEAPSPQSFSFEYLF